MPNALVLTAPQKLTTILANTPKLRLTGDRLITTSDSFTGANVTTLAGRNTDAKLGGVPELWQASVPDAWGITSGRLVTGASTADSFAAVARPAGPVEVSARFYGTAESGLIWLVAGRDALWGPTNQVRAAVMDGTAQIVYQLSGHSGAYLGTKAPIPVGGEVRLKLDGMEVELLVNNVVVSSHTLPAACPGAYSGIARSISALSFSIDDFAVTETVL